MLFAGGEFIPLDPLLLRRDAPDGDFPWSRCRGEQMGPGENGPVT